MSKNKMLHKFEFMHNSVLVSFNLDIKVSTDFKFYFTTAQLPEPLQKLPNCSLRDRQYFDSFKELEDSVTKLIEEIELAEVEEIKKTVILYQIEHEEGGVQQISFRYKVVERVEIKSSNPRKSSEINFYEKRDHRAGFGFGVNYDSFNAYSFFGSDSYKEMPWTKERELWFKEMEEAIAVLGRRLVKGFGGNSALLIKKIEQGNQFLLGVSKVTEDSE